MNFRVFAARFALVAACALMTAVPAQAKGTFWQCVTYAREISGVQIRGNAWTWWAQAAGRYERGNAPQVGAVMSFQRTRKMPLGHVATVSQVVGEREVLLTHANWSRPGRVERDVRAIDVSAAGDWSKVRVWFGPIGGLGTSTYPVNGFIYAAPASDRGWEAPLMADAGVKASPVLVAALDASLRPENLLAVGVN
ncbi:CHAP domain-containing protein [Sphingomonas hengshuiensis]|uniref:CHAP domain-containing protein n=1 Tax=Sphingomonas hengshuiensis TaxID=1609977 RepID=UPI0005CAC058|nr:CHAP domain-containing protein [Sphingomonas hengshuiensis]